MNFITIYFCSNDNFDQSLICLATGHSFVKIRLIDRKRIDGIDTDPESIFIDKNDEDP